MPYAPTDWVDLTTDVDASHMNHLEAGVDAATDTAESAAAAVAGKITAPAGVQPGDVAVWNGSAWVRPSGTRDGTKFLRDDGTYAAIGVSAGIPTGSLFQFAGPAAPTGYLICDGAAISRSTYAALYSVIGVAYGAGDNVSTFNLPDLRGRIPVGKGTHADVDALGDSDGEAVGNRRPRHRHTINEVAHSHAVTDPGHFHATQIPAQQPVAGTDHNLRNDTVSGSGDGWISDTKMTGITVGGGLTGLTVGPQASSPLDGTAFLVVNYVIKT